MSASEEMEGADFDLNEYADMALPSPGHLSTLRSPEELTFLGQDACSEMLAVLEARLSQVVQTSRVDPVLTAMLFLEPGERRREEALELVIQRFRTCCTFVKEPAGDVRLHMLCNLRLDDPELAPLTVTSVLRAIRADRREDIYYQFLHDVRMVLATWKVFSRRFAAVLGASVRPLRNLDIHVFCNWHMSHGSSLRSCPFAQTAPRVLRHPLEVTPRPLEHVLATALMLCQYGILSEDCASATPERCATVEECTRVIREYLSQELRFFMRASLAWSPELRPAKGQSAINPCGLGALLLLCDMFMSYHLDGARFAEYAVRLTAGRLAQHLHAACDHDEVSYSFLLLPVAADDYDDGQVVAMPWRLRPPHSLPLVSQFVATHDAKHLASLHLMVAVHLLAWAPAATVTAVVTTAVGEAAGDRGGSRIVTHSLFPLPEAAWGGTVVGIEQVGALFVAHAHQAPNIVGSWFQDRPEDLREQHIYQVPASVLKVWTGEAEPPACSFMCTPHPYWPGPRPEDEYHGNSQCLADYRAWRWERQQQPRGSSHRARASPRSPRRPSAVSPGATPVRRIRRRTSSTALASPPFCGSSPETPQAWTPRSSVQEHWVPPEGGLGRHSEEGPPPAFGSLPLYGHLSTIQPLDEMLWCQSGVYDVISESGQVPGGPLDAGEEDPGRWQASEVTNEGSAWAQ